MAEIDIEKQLEALKARMEDILARHRDIVSELVEVLTDTTNIGERLVKAAPYRAAEMRLMLAEMRAMAAALVPPHG